MAQRDLRPNTLPWIVGKIVLTILFHGYLRMAVEGEDNVPSTGSFLLVSNHLSNLDPFAIGIACHRKVHFLGKQEIFRIPVLSYFIRQWGAIPLDRDATDVAAMRVAVKVIRQGEILGIFPEGTRSSDGELRRFREGAAKIALRFGLPIIPVAVSGTRAALPRGAWFIRPVPIRLRFGPPLELAPLARPQSEPAALPAAAELIRARIAGLLQEGESASPTRFQSVLVGLLRGRV